MNWIRRVLFVIVIFLIIGGLVYIVPIRHSINTTMQGLQCRIGDPGYSEKVSITIKGDYLNYLFKDDTFQGKFIVDKYSFTTEDIAFPMKFQNKYALLYYIDKNRVLPKALGTVYTAPGFKKFVICIFEPSDTASNGWTGENGLFISAPAGNRSQAIDVANNLTIQNGWTNVWR